MFNTLYFVEEVSSFNCEVERSFATSSGALVPSSFIVTSSTARSP